MLSHRFESDSSVFVVRSAFALHLIDRAPGCPNCSLCARSTDAIVYHLSVTTPAIYVIIGPVGANWLKFNMLMPVSYWPVDRSHLLGCPDPRLDPKEISH